MIYAVKVGTVPGLYKTWDECKEQVSGYPGAVFKKFIDSDIDSAKTFMGAQYKEEMLKGFTPETVKTDDGTWIAYIDGSYNVHTKKCGAGVVLFHDNTKETISQIHETDEAESMRNVAGEIMAASMAIDMALKGKAKKLIIRHDYIGISEWANQNWRALNKYTQEYRRKVCEARQNIDIEFERVPAHTGNVYNDEADSLAKKACGV